MNQENKTFIKGKDEYLEASIKKMYEKLADLGFKIEIVSRLNPVEHVHSVHIRDRECHLLFTNGKGACEKSALASALGEFFERLSCNYFFADYYIGEQSSFDFVHYPNEKWFALDDDAVRKALLDEDLWEYYNPEGELLAEELLDFNSGESEKGICALPFERVCDKKSIYFPVNILGNLYVSNGMAAGNTPAEARVQALCEILERYVKNKIIAEGISLPLIPQSVLETYTHIQKSIQMIEKSGFSLRICDASLGGKYPAISVTLINPQDGSVFASFGSHPCFEVALERTVTELLQGRELDNLDDFQVPSFNLDEVASSENLETHFINATGLISYEFFKERSDYEFVDWNYDSDTQDEFEYLSELIHDENRDIYIADYEHLGIYACRVIVPNMSEIYPVEDLVWSNNNEGATFREALLSLRHLTSEQYRYLLESLEDHEVQDILKVSEFIGIVPDAQSAFETLRVGELKAMIYLVLGDLKEALEWVYWSLHVSDFTQERKKHYNCLSALLEITIDEDKESCGYEKALVMMYGDAQVLTCKELIQGRKSFYGLKSTGLDLKVFKAHTSLLYMYEKVQKIKA